MPPSFYNSKNDNHLLLLDRIENMASSSSSSTRPCLMEVEIAAYMIAIVVVVSLRVADFNGHVNWHAMNCSDVAGLVNNLLSPNESDLIFVDAVALGHGVHLFKDQVRQKGRSHKSSSAIGLSWVVERQRHLTVSPFGTLEGSFQAHLITVSHSVRDLESAWNFRYDEKDTFVAINAVKDKLLAEHQLIATRLSLVSLCIPGALATSLADLGFTVQAKAEPHWDIVMTEMKETLLKEIDELKIVATNQHTLKSLSEDDLYMNHLHESIWLACIRDTNAAPTWMQLFFWGSVSANEGRVFAIDDNPDYIKKLKEGIVLSAQDLHNDIPSDTGNFKLASKIRQRELFCDFMMQMIVHANQKTNAALEWIMTTTRCLKDSHLSSSGMDYLSKLFLSYSNTSAVDTIGTVNQTTYEESMANLKREVCSRNTEGDKKYVPVIFMDNMAVIKYAEEQKLITIKDIDGTAHSRRI